MTVYTYIEIALSLLLAILVIAVVRDNRRQPPKEKP